MQGNLHVPFLGGWAGAIPPGYPADGSNSVSLAGAKRSRMWSTARAVLSWCSTTFGGASSPDEIANNLNNINGLKFYH